MIRLWQKAYAVGSFAAGKKGAAGYKAEKVGKTRGVAGALGNKAGGVIKKFGEAGGAGKSFGNIFGKKGAFFKKGGAGYNKSWYK